METLASQNSILIIDDTPGNLRLLSQMLAGCGYKVRLATSGMQALQSIQASPPDLILLDIMMPEINGYEVCKQLKANPSTGSIPVLFMSALDAAEDKVKAFLAGAVDYITKPFQLEEVLARVKTHLTLQAMNQQLEAKNLRLQQEIIEHQQTQAALAQARDQADEANRFKSHLLARISHDLRSPLGAILGYAELLVDEQFGALNEQQKKAGAEIIQSSQYLTHLIAELLDQAQLESGRVKLQLKPMEVEQMVRQVSAQMKILAQAKGLAFTVEITPELPEILIGDEKRLQQILVNLISNAIKFTSAGTVCVTCYHPDPTHWAIRVTDDGPGIPKESYTDIFEPFYQLDNTTPSKTTEGSGLGLAIVKQLVALMEGQIILESEVGRGSTFLVLLPLVQPGEFQDSHSSNK